MLLKSLYPDIRLNAPAAPDIVIERMAWRATRDFLTKSKVWKSELVNPMPFTEGATSFDPTPQVPTGTVPIAINKVRWRPTGQDIDFLTKDQLTESFPGWETETAQEPDYWTLNAPSIARLYPIAETTVADAVEMEVVLTLGEGHTTIPDWLYYKHDEDLIAGALSYLYAMPRREWTDMQLANARALQFSNAVNRAKAEGESNHGRPSYEVVYGGL